MIRRRLNNPDPLLCVIIDFPVALKLLPQIVNLRHLSPLAAEIFALDVIYIQAKSHLVAVASTLEVIFLVIE